MRAVAASALLGTILAVSSPAFAQDLRPVQLALGTTTINIGYPNDTLPIALGYWKEEGLDVEVIAAGATLQGIQQLVGGGVQFAEGNASGFLQAISENNLPLRLSITHSVVDWKFVVPKGSDIRDAQSLKGKRIGIISLASGATPLLKAYLSGNGVSPDDVEVIPVGFGAAPVEALRKGDVDTLLYWGTAVAAFENAGLEMDTFVPEAWPQLPDYVLTTTTAIAESDPDMVVGMARGMAKAILFVRTNPECALDIHWKNHPDTRSQGPDEATSRAWDMNILKAKITSYEDAMKLSDTWGAVDQKYWDGLQTYLIETQQISKEVAPGDFLVSIPDFFARVNDFDHDAIVAQARACDF